MSMESICGKCGRQLSLEEVATLVACPSCHALLPPVAFDSAYAAKSRPDREVGTDTADFTLQSTFDLSTAGGEASLPLEPPDEPRTTVYDREFCDIQLAISTGADAESSPEESTDAVAAGNVENPGVPGSLAAFDGPPVSESPVTIQNVARPLPPATHPAAAPSTASGASPFLFRLVLSYASAITLVCLYLLYLLFNPSPGVDLPDIRPHTPKEANRVTVLEYVRPENQLPRAYRLRLGQSQRFGSIDITPLRVARGPLRFAFSEPDAVEPRPDSLPVLQLHLQIENVSADQVFAPLDPQLVFTKEPDGKKFGWYKANNWLCRTDERAAHDRHVMVYDLSPDSNWQIAGQNLDRELRPGESIETFIPTTEEGWESLSGDLVWRVHLRKGYNPQSLNGVTTLVEVLFNSSEITDETPADARHAATATL